MTACLKHAGAARYTYNWGLNQKKMAYENGEKTPNAIELHRRLNALKPTELPWMYEVSKCSPQEALRNLDRAFDNFFKKRGKFPRYKSKKNGIGSFRLTGTIKVSDGHVQLPRMGRLKLKERGDWFVVSGVSNIQSKLPSLAEFKVGNDAYRIVKSVHNKCERCWKRSADQELSPMSEGGCLGLQPDKIVVESGRRFTMSDSVPEGDFNAVLGEVITGLVARFEEDRQKSDPWKELFAASEGGLRGLLSEAQHKTNSIILDLSSVIQKKFGLKRTSRKLYDLLKALPFAMNHLRDHIQNEDSNSCCADKARMVYYEEVLAEIKRIQAEQDNGS